MSEETDLSSRVVTALYSATVVVSDQDRAVAFYRDVLGCEVRADFEAWPGARVVEVIPPGSAVAIALLTTDSELPLGVRWRTADADAAHRSFVAHGVRPHTDVVRLDGSPPMFTFDDPDGNTVIVMQDQDVPADDGRLPVIAVLAALPVSDADTARVFYEQLLGAPPDDAPMPGLTQWRLGDGVLQVVVDADRAGGGLATLVFDDLAAAAEGLRARGVGLDVAEGEVVTSVARVVDPDGNVITLVQT
ncbi:VOC family protein [Nocardioides sp. 1609]|uniref:VOC family protein n=1 Tax=Nocardioides sp. 1609 TaxID=2508327 RepID=UPI001ADBF4A4|nr:VOC family protein [Nocardioides sp. 1609]